MAKCLGEILPKPRNPNIGYPVPSLVTHALLHALYTNESFLGPKTQCSKVPIHQHVKRHFLLKELYWDLNFPAALLEK